MKTTPIGTLLMIAAAAAPATAQINLNEIYPSHVGTDTQEYIELIGPGGTALTNVMVLVVEGDGTIPGGTALLDRAWDLSALSIPTDGFFVLGDTAVTSKDFDIGASDRIENGTETFYLLSAIDPVAVAALVGTNVKTGAGTTSIGTLGTILDSVGMVDGGFPATDEVFDGAQVLGPDGTFFPPGVYRHADFPRGWAGNFLEFDLAVVAEPFAPLTPGAKNPPANPWVRISEYMYNGNGDEFIEFTNVGSLPTDMTGWSFDDDSNLPGVQPLSGFGTVAPGTAVVLAEAATASFKADWGLPAAANVIGGLTANLGMNDRINLFAPNGYVVDRLNFGPTTFPGSYRTQDFSAWACADVLGADNIFGWVGSIVGDGQGTVMSGSGDIGSPGTHVSVSPCADWLGLGNSKLSSSGDSPVLIGKGTLVSGDLVSLAIHDAPPSTPTLLVLGLTNVSVPYGGGGILVPAPDIAVVIATDPLGHIEITTPWPAGVPNGFTLYYQLLFSDPPVPAGICATNAYQSTTP